MISYDDIKNSVSISNILGRYGFSVPEHDKFHILCPFHQEKTASFYVDEEKRRWHCFGCGASGSVLDLVARFDRVSIKEAAQKLSTEFGIESSRISIDARRIKSKLDKWKTKPRNGMVSVPYDLRSLPVGYRNLDKQSIDHFHLSITDHGVFIPHYDLTGQMVGYSIRHPEGIHPKYLNSIGLPKGIPYGLHQNKGDIISKGFAIVVEGQFDCITTWGRGYKNVIALMGSSMSEQQAHILLAITTRLLLLFDGDRAGRSGAAQTVKRWSGVFTTKIALLPNGTDPADYLDENP